MFEYLNGCRRNYYRLRYPLSHRPKLCLAGTDREYEVTELSERGLRLRCATYSASFQLGKRVTATIMLPQHDVEVSGMVARRDFDEVVVVNVDGVSFRLIMAEQRRLASTFLAAIDNT
jgi:hypothetical protein